GTGRGVPGEVAARPQRGQRLLQLLAEQAYGAGPLTDQRVAVHAHALGRAFRQPLRAHVAGGTLERMAGIAERIPLPRRAGSLEFRQAFARVAGALAEETLHEFFAQPH